MVANATALSKDAAVVNGDVIVVDEDGHVLLDCFSVGYAAWWREENSRGRQLRIMRLVQLNSTTGWRECAGREIVPTLREIVAKVVREFNGNHSEAARALQVTRQTIASLLGKES